VVQSVHHPCAEPARYVPGLNMGGYAPAQDVGAALGEFEMVFGKRAFFAFAVAPDGAVWWLVNPPRRTEPAPGELEAWATYDLIS
jgi:FAD-dependent urate hydroxylase